MNLEDYLSPFTTRSLLPARQSADTWISVSPQALQRTTLRDRESLEESSLYKLTSRFSDFTVEDAQRRRPYVVHKLKKSTFRWYADKKRMSDEGHFLKVITPQPEVAPKSCKRHHHTIRLPRLPPLPPLPKPRHQPKPRPHPISLACEPPLTPRAWTPLPF